MPSLEINVQSCFNEKEINFLVRDKIHHWIRKVRVNSSYFIVVICYQFSNLLQHVIRCCVETLFLYFVIALYRLSLILFHILNTCATFLKLGSFIRVFTLFIFLVLIYAHYLNLKVKEGIKNKNDFENYIK